MRKLLRWFCASHLLEEIEGDLEETFVYNKDTRNRRYAIYHYSREVLFLIRPSVIKKLKLNHSNNTIMLNNYLIIAIRNLRKQRISSLLNIIGLSLGIGSSLLIILHVKQELSYENDFAQADNIYRISYQTWAKTSPPLKDFLATNLPEASLVSQVAAFGTEVVRTDQYKAEVENGYYADAEFFEIFGLNFIDGQPQEKLNMPFKVVLTETMAKQFFGDKDPVGDVVIFDDKWDYEVIAVVEDLPKKSHLKMDYFITMPTFYKRTPESWTSNRNWMVTYTYARFEDHIEADQIHSKLHEATYAFYPDDPREEVDKAEAHLKADPIKSIHLNSHKEQEMNANGDITLVYIFSALAIFISLIACINFTNIFTTQAIKRSKEIGVRKVLGAKRTQLVFQFLSEAYITTLLAALLGMLLASLVLPSYNQLVTQPLSYADIFTSSNLTLLLGLILIVGCLSGAYPAFYISRQQSLKALKSQKGSASMGTILRKVLVVFQFAVSIVMMTGTLVLFLQTNYIKSKNLGFNKEQVIGVKFYGEFRNYLRQNWETFQSQLTENTTITSAALASNLPGDRLSMEYVTPVGADPKQEFPSVRVMRVDEHYLETMGIMIQKGRNFLSYSDTSTAFILNKKAVESLKIENPVGTLVENQSHGVQGAIVGIIDNFHFSSHHEEVEPLVLSYRPGWTGILLVRLEGGNTEAALSQVEEEIKAVSPETLVDYEFLDSRLESMYKAEANMGKVVNLFSLLAIFISGLGLFGLMAYTTEVRTKEIGIRKVLGASGLKIASVLTSDFTKLILVSIIVAVPVSYYLALEWLNRFAFKVDLAWWIFAVIGLLTLLFALVTISFQTIKAARINPINTLKAE